MTRPNTMSRALLPSAYKPVKRRDDNSFAPSVLSAANSDEGRLAARTYLSRSLTIERDIMLMNARLDTLRRRGIQVSALSSPRAATSGARDAVGDVAAAIADLESDALNAYARLTALEKEIADTINRVGDPLLRQILHMRYIEVVSPSAIAARLHMTDSNFYRLHKRALTVVAALLLTRGSTNR